MTKGAFQKDHPSVKGLQMTVMTVTISVHLSLFSKDLHHLPRTPSRTRRLFQVSKMIPSE